MISHAPAWAEHWQSSDPDEVVARFATSGRHRREVIGVRAFRYRTAVASLGDLLLGWGESSAAQRIEATPVVSILHVPLETCISYRFGKSHLEARPGGAVFIPAARDYSAAYLGGRWLAFSMPSEALEKRRALLTGRPARPPGPVAFAIRQKELAGLLAPLHLPAPGDGDANGLRLRRVGDSLLDWLAGQVDRGAPTRSPGSVAQARARRVEEWVDEHLAEPLGLGQLCEVAGIEARGLQKYFRQHRGVTPLRWVRDRRLATARYRLLHAEGGDTVTAIALRCGFTHLGRFSIAFRQRYGQSPSDVLAAVQTR